MAYLSANGGSAFISRNMSNYGTILNGVVTAGMAIATGGMSLMLGGAQSVFSDVSKIAESDKRVNDIMMTPPSISSYGTPSTRNVFGTNNVRVLKYSVSEKVKTKIRAYIERYGNKFNNYALIDLKSYNGFIKYISPNIDSRIDNIYINKIKEILERGVYIE
jgi:hypothetical protein